MLLNVKNKQVNSLINFVNCPVCGIACTVKYNSAGMCSKCGQKWKSNGCTIEWFYVPADPFYGEKSSQWLIGNKAGGISKIIFIIKEIVRSAVKFVAFPLRWFSDLRVQNYYSRVLSDKRLAISWAAHYFYGASIPPAATILDHGCGRGRIVGILNQLGYAVAGQEVRDHTWWKNINNACFQVVSPDWQHLPWSNASFDAVINVGVICHLTDEQLSAHAREVERVLRPGGYWILLENNHRYYGAAYAKKWYGRVHTNELISKVALSAGLNQTHFSYEGFWSPVFPHVIHYLRKIIFSRKFDISDYNSWLAKIIPIHRRRWCVFHFRKSKID